MSLKRFPDGARKALRRRFLDFTCSFLDVQRIDPRAGALHRAAKVVLMAMRGVSGMDDPRYGELLREMSGLPPAYRWLQSSDIALCGMVC